MFRTTDVVDLRLHIHTGNFLPRLHAHRARCVFANENIPPSRPIKYSKAFRTLSRFQFASMLLHERAAYSLWYLKFDIESARKFSRSLLGWIGRLSRGRRGWGWTFGVQHACDRVLNFSVYKLSYCRRNLSLIFNFSIIDVGEFYDSGIFNVFATTFSFRTLWCFKLSHCRGNVFASFLELGDVWNLGFFNI